jgi:hypothetical protein
LHSKWAKILQCRAITDANPLTPLNSNFSCYQNPKINEQPFPPYRKQFALTLFAEICPMNRRLALHLAFWLAYWFIYAYTYSRYDGNLPKYLLTEGLQMPARMLATYAAMWCFEHFSTLSPSHTSHPLSTASPPSHPANSH